MSNDPLWMKALLAVHIACGFTAFLLAPVALATAKGGRQHKRWGMVYLWAMGGVAATALPMALYRPVLFLALVAIFSFYLAFSGYRILKLKDLPRGGRPKPVDWIAALLTLATTATLAGLSAFRPHAVQNMSIVGVFLSFFGMRVASVELSKFTRKPVDLVFLTGYSIFLGVCGVLHLAWTHGLAVWLMVAGAAGTIAFGRRLLTWTYRPLEKMFWWYTHLGNFIGSYIAAWAAFSVVTLGPRFAPHMGDAGWLVWVWPVLVGAPAIALTTIYYKRKFAPRSKPSVLSTVAGS